MVLPEDNVAIVVQGTKHVCHFETRKGTKGGSQDGGAPAIQDPGSGQ